MKNKSNNVYNNNGYWYIRYKHPITNIWSAASTGLKATQRNLKKANEYKTEFLEKVELTKTEYLDLTVTEGTISEAFDKFKKVNHQMHLNTKNGYDYFYRYFSQFFVASSSCIIITKRTFEDWAIWVGQLDKAQNTKFNIFKNGMKFLKFLFEYGYVPKEFKVNNELKIRGERKRIVVFSDETREQIISSLKPFEKNNNFTTLIYLLLYTGLRPSDILQITVDQVDTENRTIQTYMPKVKSWIKIPYHEILDDILIARKKEVKSGPLVNYAGSKEASRQMRVYLQQLGFKEKGYTLRTFRKDFISRAQKNGIPVTVTATLVGHKNIKTTNDYYTHFSTEEMANELKKLKV